MSNITKVFEDRENLGEWRIEWIDDDGTCEAATFSGHDAHKQALRHAIQKYRHFRDVQLGPAPG